MYGVHLQRRRNVSIHAFRGEGDSPRLRCKQHWQRFNPRLPGGRRPRVWIDPKRMSEFQSTPSGGKATLPSSYGVMLQVVSIHAFRGEGDQREGRETVKLVEFQSTPSGGKATRLPRRAALDVGCFNPRLPGGRRPVTVVRSLLI